MNKKNNIEEINITKVFFFNSIKLVNWSFSNQNDDKEKREMLQITSIKSKRRDITTDPTDIKKIREYYEQPNLH